MYGTTEKVKLFCGRKSSFRWARSLIAEIAYHLRKWYTISIMIIAQLPMLNNGMGNGRRDYNS